jgi:hypothetical protein
MKSTVAILAASLLAIGPAAAEESHDHSIPADKPSMHQHMKLMREQMAQIRAATDPKERERLMNEHMKTMEQSMAKMQGMMGCAKM